MCDYGDRIKLIIRGHQNNINAAVKMLKDGMHTGKDAAANGAMLSRAQYHKEILDAVMNDITRMEAKGENAKNPNH